MALTEYDKKHLSSNDQNKILAATKKWNDANAKGDTKGMAAAQEEAAAVRKSAGYHSNPDGSYGGSYVSVSGTKNTSGGGSSGGGSNKNSQYTGSGYTIGSTKGQQAAQNLAIGDKYYASDGSVWTKGNDGYISVTTKDGQKFNNVYRQGDLGILGQQQVNAGVPYSYVQSTMDERYNKIANNPELAKYLNDGTFQMLQNYINDQENAEIKAEYEGLLDEYEQDRPDEYSNPYQDDINRLFGEILNRGDFSYDIMSDPLYQQYADMYRREGDRAMRNAMAEVAAGAGGMNTYAMTAAQQANSYYNSQLNDVIPELYQAAYDRWLKDIDLKVQDMGLLQHMDATEYARYRDTMTDWNNDRNFAYGAYQDAVQQGNWNTANNNNEYWANTEFANNNYWNNKNFDYNDYWANKEFNYNDEWRNKEWNENIADKEYDRTLYDKEMAIDEVWRYIEMGVTPSADLIARAGMSAEDVNLAVAAVKAEQARSAASSIVASGGSSGGGSSSSGGNSSSGIEDNGNGYEGVVSGPEEPVKPVQDVSSSTMINLGIGPIGLETLNKLAKAGAITVKNDGSVQWANGYGPNNWQDALNKLNIIGY